MDKNNLNKLLTFVSMALLAAGILLFATSDFLGENADYAKLIGGIVCGLLSSFVKTYVDMNK